LRDACDHPLPTPYTPTPYPPPTHPPPTASPPPTHKKRKREGREEGRKEEVKGLRKEEKEGYLPAPGDLHHQTLVEHALELGEPSTCHMELAAP